MTLLSFIHGRDSFQILTDTLATTPNGEPLLFIDKAYPYSSRDMVMAGTGIAALLIRWDAVLRESAFGLDVCQIDAIAPDSLRDIWSDLRSEHDLPAETTATVYHFGFEHGTSKPVRYAYRSKNEFRSESSRDEDFAIKPHPSEFRIPESYDDWINIARELREEQDSGSTDGRVWIGGQLVLTTLNPGQISQKRMYEFPDYAAHWNRMNEVSGLT